MEKLRINPPKAFDTFKVEAVRDYKTSIRLDMNTGAKTKLDLRCLMFSITNWKMMHGAVQDLQVQNQRSSFIWALREHLLKMETGCWLN